MTPPVRGWQRVRVAGLFAAAGLAAGGLAGFAIGAGWAAARLPELGPSAAFALVAGAVAGDLAASRSARLRPLAVRRQVPTAWSAVFSAETVAVLYGARLGVGPLTILPTWLWWAAVVLGASAGPWPGALVGATFAAARAATTLAAAEAIAGDAPRRMARLITVGRATAPVIALAALAVSGAGFVRGW